MNSFQHALPKDGSKMHSHSPSLSLSLQHTHAHTLAVLLQFQQHHLRFGLITVPCPSSPCTVPLASNQIYGSSVTLASFYFIFFFFFACLVLRFSPSPPLLCSLSLSLTTLHSTPPSTALAAASVSWHCFCAAPPTGFWLIALTLAFALPLLSRSLCYRSLSRHAHVP